MIDFWAYFFLIGGAVVMAQAIYEFGLLPQLRVSLSIKALETFYELQDFEDGEAKEFLSEWALSISERMHSLDLKTVLAVLCEMNPAQWKGLNDDIVKTLSLLVTHQQLAKSLGRLSAIILLAVICNSLFLVGILSPFVFCALAFLAIIKPLSLYHMLYRTSHALIPLT